MNKNTRYEERLQFNAQIKEYSLKNPKLLYSGEEKQEYEDKIAASRIPILSSKVYCRGR